MTVAFFILGVLIGWFGAHVLIGMSRAGKSQQSFGVIVRESEEAIESVRLEEL